MNIAFITPLIFKQSAVMGSGKRGHIGKVVSSQKRGITPEFAIKELRKQGIEIDEKQAENILEMMYFLDKLVVNQSFKL